MTTKLLEAIPQTLAKGPQHQTFQKSIKDTDKNTDRDAEKGIVSATDFESYGFIEKLLEISSKYPNLTAIQILETNRTLTYSQLVELVEKLKTVFISLNLHVGDRVVLQLPQCPEMIASFYALASLGIIAVPVSPGLTEPETLQILEDCKPLGIVSISGTHQFFPFQFVLEVEPPVAKAKPAKASVPTLTHSNLTQTKILSLEELFKKMRTATSKNRLGPPCGNVYVSCHYTYKGLGYPLGAIHRYHEYSACSAGMMQDFQQEVGAIHFVGLPIYPVYGLTACVLTPLSFGCKLILTNKTSDLDLVTILEDHQVQFATLVPFLLERLIQAALVHKKNRNLRFHPNLTLVSGGSYLEPALSATALEVLGLEPYQGYGLSETLPLTGNHPGAFQRGSLGVPLCKNTQIAIMGNEGQELSAGQAGEIAVRGPSIMEGYYGRPRDTANFFRKGWFHTGDLGMLDKKGFLHFLGRRIPITKIASQMVDLIEIESVIQVHPEVARARVIIRRDPKRGREFISASIVLKEGSTIGSNEIKNLCQKRLSSHKIPRNFKFFRQRLVMETWA